MYANNFNVSNYASFGCFTFKVSVPESATSVGTMPDVKKVKVIITSADKLDSYTPIKLQLQIHACFELSMLFCQLFFLSHFDAWLNIYLNDIFYPELLFFQNQSNTVFHLENVRF